MKLLILRIAVFLAILFSLQIVLVLNIVKNIEINRISEGLERMTHRINDDLKYSNGILDTTLYDNDPETPHPNGSSGYPHPLYIFLSNGVVVERNNPISGFFDASDYKKLLDYKEPKTVQSQKDENWRVLSSPITNNNQIEGVVFVSYYDPNISQLNKVDMILKQGLDYLKTKVRYENGRISTEDLDVRDIHYDISFEIIDKYNIVHLNNGRTPVFIDPSYLAQEFDNPQKRFIKDTKTNEQFLVYSKVIYDEDNSPVGLIILGKSFADLNNLLKIFLLYSTLINILLILPLSMIIIYLRLNKFKSQITKSLSGSTNHKKIILNLKESFLEIDGNVIDIPYSSNQYYLCKTIFSKPDKRHEKDEILEKFGIEDLKANNRIVYDAMLAVNRKVGFKLLEYKNKTYRLNPLYLNHSSLINH